MTKKILPLVLALALAFGMFTFPTFATDPIRVYLDGRALTFDVPPQLINDRTMVPLRTIFEAMGAKVDWDGDTETVTGTKDSTIVILKIGNTSPTINGNVVTIDQPGVIIDGRTLAPLRFVAEAFGGSVDWDGNTQTASITMDGAAATTLPATTTTLSGLPQGNTGIVGVWLGTRTPDFSWEYIMFYEDGTFRYQLPRDGFYGFYSANDKANNQGNNIWGSYSFSGNTGTWKYDAASASSSITLESDGGLDLGSLYNKFYRCNSVDNYKLDGSYTSYSNPSDPDLKNAGEKPVIHFKSDGTFSDDGLFSMVGYLQGIGETDEQYAPGSGRYEIRDFTLILRYSDGRVRQTSFTFAIGPNSTDASVYILICNGFELNRMP